MFLLNRIVTSEFNNGSKDVSIKHSNIASIWDFACNFYSKNNGYIQLRQRSIAFNYEMGVILELVCANGKVLNRTQFILVDPNDSDGCVGKIRCGLRIAKSTINQCDIAGLRSQAIIFTRDPVKPYNPLPGTTSFFNSYKNLFNDKESADIVVKASDGVELKVHKSPLMTRSSTFKTMFGIDMTEKQTGTVHIEDFDSTVLNELFRFIYYNEVEGIDEIYVELLKAAKRYEIEVLPELCAKSIMMNFPDMEIWEVLKLAHVYELQELFEFIVCIFFANFEFYSEQEEWKKEQDFSMKAKVYEFIVKIQMKQPHNNLGIKLDV